ncbi:MAG: hypothetical protein K2G10_04145, partial [Alistipes sp.]|nr:hypothetical protein [Alistipes sp.]
GAAAQDRHRNPLQLAVVGIVDDLLLVGKPNQPLMDPAHRKESYGKRNQRQQPFVCLKNLAHKPQIYCYRQFIVLQLFRQPAPVSGRIPATNGRIRRLRTAGDHPI